MPDNFWFLVLYPKPPQNHEIFTDFFTRSSSKEKLVAFHFICVVKNS